MYIYQEPLRLRWKNICCCAWRCCTPPLVRCSDASQITDDDESYSRITTQLSAWKREKPHSVAAVIRANFHYRSDKARHNEQDITEHS